MKFALFATAIVAVSAIRMERSLNGEAANEEDTWEAYQNAKKAVDAAEEVYITKKAAARATEVELQREINETIAQEKVVKKANKVKDKTLNQDKITLSLKKVKTVLKRINKIMGREINKMVVNNQANKVSKKVRT